MGTDDGRGEADHEGAFADRRSADHGAFGLDPAAFLANNEIDQLLRAPGLAWPGPTFAHLNDIRAFLVDIA